MFFVVGNSDICVNKSKIPMENQKKHPIHVSAQEGMTVSVVGDTYRIIMGGEQTGGAFACIDMLIPPGGGPGPHAHPDFEESFYVLDGSVEVRSEFGDFTASKGAFINVPKGGVVHGFKNTSDQLAHLLCLVVPAGLEAFFAEIGQPVKSGEFLPPPHMDEAAVKKLQAIAQTYGQTVFPPDYLE
jgi:quercetin dioxygenase-like cupin family protein